MVQIQSMDSEKSRRERRKEARLEKNKKKFDSWVEHQKSHKKKKTTCDAASKKLKELQNNAHTLDKKREVMPVKFDCSSCQNLEEPSMQEFQHNKTSAGVSASNALKANRTKKKRDPKNKLEKYLELEKMLGSVTSAEEDLRLERKLAKRLKVKDGKLGGPDDGINILFEGIPSFSESLDGKEKPFVEEESRNSTKKCKRKLENEELDGDILNDGMDHQINVKAKKTNFEEYVELDVQQGIVSANEDIALVRKLAKKLKVKEGKLSRDDDCINQLFEEIPSVHDSLEDKEILAGKVTPVKSTEKSSMHDKHKKKASKKEIDVEATHDPIVSLCEQFKTSNAEYSLEIVPAKVTVPEGNSKYVAPHLRSCVGDESKEYSQTRRRVRGLINRLSESNVESITGEMSTIFHSMARTAASQIIIKEVLASCSGGPRGNEQHAAVFAAFVAGTACLVGIDFGAKLLASLAKCFEDEYVEEDNLSLRNLTLLLSYLYIFGVCSSDLIYNFLITLSKRLMEIDVSTILTILQCCGMRLRGDDPSAMRNFILSVQGRADELKTLDVNSNKSSKRMEFMLETICDIKNNKKRQKEDTIQHSRIKKWLQKLRIEDILIRGLKWNKLLDSNKKGQWWLSGDMSSIRDNIEEVASTIDREVPETQKMLQLAAAQRMNTDARRSIFCIIMSGEDYIDAFEKLLRLDLPGKQDREIMRVLVECCLQEEVFNKYYCVLASKLCSHDKNHKFTLQYCIWDHIKELETMQLLRSMHLAKFVAEMLASFSLSLGVLKVIDLSDTNQLTPKRIMHLRMLFESILGFSDKLIWSIFTRIAVTLEYETMRNGIEFFVSKYVISFQRSLLGKFKLAKKALNNVEGVLI